MGPVNDGYFCRVMILFQQVSFSGPTLFIGFLVVHMFLVESSKERKSTFLLLVLVVVFLNL
jgi:hypothetical protein